MKGPNATGPNATGVQHSNEIEGIVVFIWAGHVVIWSPATAFMGCIAIPFTVYDEGGRYALPVSSVAAKRRSRRFQLDIYFHLVDNLWDQT